MLWLIKILFIKYMSEIFEYEIECYLRQKKKRTFLYLECSTKLSVHSMLKNKNNNIETNYLKISITELKLVPTLTANMISIIIIHFKTFTFRHLTLSNIQSHIVSYFDSDGGQSVDYKEQVLHDVCVVMFVH